MTLVVWVVFINNFLVNLYHNFKFLKLFSRKALCLIEFIIIILMLIMKNA